MTPLHSQEWRDARRYDGDKPKDSRSDAQRDRDRVLYCSAFRRLGGVTQVVLAEDEGHLFHNRLTHSLKVAQVGRRIAERLQSDGRDDKDLAAIIDRWGGLDPDVVETAGLAHDLGHPPFGHIGEDELQIAIVGRQVPDSFEGNAQSFRIVAYLESIDLRFRGLNLTRASLNAILKYPWVGRTRTDSKWGAYDSEKKVFDWARDGLVLPQREPTLEAQIMDWADDITYAVHDVEDFYRAGFIPLHELTGKNNQDVADLFPRVIRRLGEYKYRPLKPAAKITELKRAANWGLRDYGTATWDGGDPDCDHTINRDRRDCKCGARRIDAQLGLEATPEEYVANMVAVFREVKRVLRADGTLWLNLGDSYAGSGPSGAAYQSKTTLRRAAGDGTDGAFRVSKRLAERGLTYAEKKPVPPTGLKPKDLVGIPWRVAFALQADGWYLRSDIIWAKPNPMPESVTDRPTKAHEYLFLLSKAPRYYYDADAVREAVADATVERFQYTHQYATRAHREGAIPISGGIREPAPSGRNLRSVWSIATEPYPGAHFATFPRKLVEPCVRAGTSERGVCPECGAPWVRVVERTPDDRVQYRTVGAGPKANELGKVNPLQKVLRQDGKGGDLATARVTTTGWRPSCAHDAEPVPAAVLDPFAGSGTTLLVAQALGRRGVGIDLNPDYLQQAIVRASREFGKAARTEDTSPPTDGLWGAA